jgi:hypothetical protein
MKDFLLFIFKLLLAGLAYFAEIKNLFVAVLIFMALDWVTGVYASFKHRTKGECWFTSSKMRRTVEKFVFYMMAIGVSFIFRVEFIESIPLGKIVAGYIAITEIKSIFENISKIMGVQLFNELWLIIKDKFFGHYQINDPKNNQS